MVLLSQMGLMAASVHNSLDRSTQAPEPSTLLLMSLPLLAIGASRAFRKKSNDKL